jgi:hypothetical protein
VSFFDKSRDFLAQQAIAYRFRRYVERMTQFSLDSKEQKINFSVELKGETEPLAGEVRYQLSQGDGAALTVRIVDIKLSKEWMNLAAQDFVIGKEFSLEDARVATLLKILRVI